MPRKKKTEVTAKASVKKSNQKSKEKTQEKETVVETITDDSSPPNEDESKVNVEVITDEVKEETKAKVKTIRLGSPILNEYLDKYLESLQTNNHVEAGNSLKNIIYILTSKFDKDNYERLFKFFETYKDNMLVEEKALAGTAYMPAATRTRMEVVYSVMRRLTVDPVSFRRSVSIDMLRTIMKDEDAVNWMVRKAKMLIKKNG